MRAEAVLGVRDAEFRGKPICPESSRSKSSSVNERNLLLNMLLRLRFVPTPAVQEVPGWQHDHFDHPCAALDLEEVLPDDPG